MSCGRIILFCFVLASRTLHSQTLTHQNQESLARLNKIDSLLLVINKQSEDTNKAMSLVRLSMLLKDQDNQSKALVYANQAMTLSEKLENKRCMALAHDGLGTIYSIMGKLPRSLEHHLKAKKLNEETDSKLGIADSHMYLGNIYEEMNKKEEAKKEFLEMLALCREINSGLGQAMAYNQLGNIENALGAYDKALDYYFKAEKTLEKLKGDTYLDAVYQSIAITYGGQKKYDDALLYLNKSLALQESKKQKSAVAQTLYNMACTYYFKGNVEKAREFCERALNISNESGYLRIIQGAEDLMAVIYARKGEGFKALEHYQASIRIRDSIMNDEISKKLLQTEMDFKLERERERREKQEAGAKQEIKFQRTILLVSVSFFVAVLLAIVMYIRGYRNKTRTSAIINDQLSNIKGQEMERTRIAKELHDGIGGTLAGIKLGLQDLQSAQPNEKLDKLILQVGEACKEVRNISHNLMPLAVSNALFVEVMQGLARSFVIPGKLNVELNFFQPNEINALPSHMRADVYRITQELLNNVVKYAEASLVSIGLLVQDNSLHLSIEDNGKGFDPGEVKQGIGLRSISSRVSLLQGKWDLDSRPGRGTAVNIDLPLTGQS